MSAALWCAEIGLTCVIIERRPQLGGQLESIHNPIRNYLGLEAAHGLEMREKFISRVHKLPAELVTGVEVENLDVNRRLVTLSNGRCLECTSLILATGVRRRTLGVPGEMEFMGLGMMTSGVGEKTVARGKVVAVVGGGDAALENALILSEVAERVIVIHRRSEFSARREFIEASRRRHNVEFRTGAVVRSIYGDEWISGILIDSSESEPEIAVEFVLVRIGVIPNSEFATGELELDASGFIVVDHTGLTSAPHVFAVGDVANPTSPTISTATGTAATAVKSISDNPIN